MAPTYDPQTGLFYVTARDQCDIFSTAPQPYEAGHAFYGSAYFPSEEAEPYLRIPEGDRSSDGRGQIEVPAHQSRLGRACSRPPAA